MLQLENQDATILQYNATILNYNATIRKSSCDKLKIQHELYD